LVTAGRAQTTQRMQWWIRKLGSSNASRWHRHASGHLPVYYGGACLSRGQGGEPCCPCNWSLQRNVDGDVRWVRRMEIRSETCHQTVNRLREPYASDDSWSSIRAVFTSFAHGGLRVRPRKYLDIERVDRDNFDALMARWLDRIEYIKYPNNIILWVSA
jgi:hypothetical protein